MNQDRRYCSICGAETEDRTITYTQTIGERVFVVTDVPAEVCPHDGEQYLSPEVVDALQALIEQTSPPKRIIQVPVYQFPQAVA